MPLNFIQHAIVRIMPVRGILKNMVEKDSLCFSLNFVANSYEQDNLT